MKLYQKISKVMEDVSYLQKDDNIKFGNTNYKAISEEKVTLTVRQSMVKHGLVIMPIKQEHSRDGNLSTVNVTYKLVDIETGDFVEIVSSGTGMDTQDKGVGKAMTYAYKYLLLRTFAIPTGEDPDKVCNEELEAKQKEAAKAKEKKDASRIEKARESYRKLLMENPHVFTKEDIKKYADGTNWKIENYENGYRSLSVLKKEREEILQLENQKS